MNKLDKTKLIAERRRAIGGTDVSGIMGVNPWRTAVDVWLEKCGKPSRQSDHLKKIELKLECGNRLEPIVIDLFESKTNIRVQREVPVIKHPKYDYMIAHVDGLIGDDPNGGIFEAKTAGLNALLQKSWGTPRKAKESTKDDIPVQYYYQINWYMMITNRSYAYLAVLLGGVDDFRIYYFERDYSLSVRMRSAVKKFWNNYVLKETPPPPVSAQDANQIYPKHKTEYKICTDKIKRVILKNKSLRSELKKLLGQKERLDAVITSYIGENEGIKDNQNTLATWKEAKNGKRILRLY